MFKIMLDSMEALRSYYEKDISALLDKMYNSVQNDCMCR